MFDRGFCPMKLIAYLMIRVGIGRKRLTHSYLISKELEPIY